MPPPPRQPPSPRHRGRPERAAPAPAVGRRTVLSTRRLESYTDGVFAIAATLLVLNLSVDGFAAVESEAAFARRLTEVVPAVLNVVISFVLLSVLWLVHVRQFEFIPRVDTTTIWLNNIRLLCVVLVPFTTSLNDDFSGFVLGRTLLPLNFMLIVALSTWQWFHVTSPRHRLVQGASDAMVRNGRANSVSALVQSVAVVLLATMIGSAAFLVFALDPLVGRMLRRIGVLHPSPGTAWDG
jgi:uncharacterized membrane protein